MKKYFSSFNSLKSLFNPLNSLCPSIIGVAVLLPLVACLASCRNELLEPPDFSDKGGTYSSTNISAPEGVSATQGGFRSITLSWKQVANAVKYEVYTTKIATTVFEKRTETNGADKISVEIKEDADVIVYFKVKAYDKNGNASEFSKMCHGTTLGAPIITNIIQDELGKSATVRWWCGTYFAASTYKNEVKYSIALYADAEGTTKIAEQEMDGSAIKMTNDVSDGEISAECTFTGLSPKTTYYYQVKAYLKDSPDKVEASAIVDKETARRLIPNPVEGLEATQGISDKEVTLSFILPDFVDVKESSDVFLKKPLYFEISRAEIEYTASEEIDEKTGRTIYTEGKKPVKDYTVIATIRAAASSGWNTESGSSYYFDCTSDDNNTSSKKLTLEKTDGVESNEGDAEPYIPGYKVTFTDTTAQRGDDKPPVYSYKITSYADVEKKVTSDESLAKATGWLIGNLKLDLSAKKVDYEYADADESQISKITVKLSCTFEDYGKDYTYIVTQSAIDTKDTPIVDETIVKNMDIKELKDFSIVYDLSKDKEGYYSYKFYIAPKGAENFSNAYYCYDKYRTETLVVKDKPLEIKRFEVEDGYSDKFVVRWSYNPEFTYKLSWTPVVNGADQDPESMAFGASLENNDGDVGVITSVDSDGMAIFEHAATSGDIRKYSIKITSRLSLPKDFESSSYTLGTAVAKQVGYAYDAITVEWDKVQKADSYTLDAWYEDNVGVPPINIDNIMGETSYTFIPNKSDDATIAGKKVNVCITAKNAKASTRSDAIPTRLIGPAEVDAKVNTFDEATEDSISISWNEVEGANGYLIRRVMYSDTAANKIANDSGVTYYYDATSGKITLEDGGEVADRATVNTTETGFALTDKYMEMDTGDNDLKSYQNAQAKISWGLPFKYIVLPVLEKNDFDFYSFAFESKGKVEYENLLPSAATATFGYGQKVHAKKLESATNQEVSWEEPFYGKNLTPIVYKRKFTPKNDDDAKWTPVNANIKDNAIDYPLSGDERYCAWEYVVKYVNSESNNTIAPSYLDWLNAIENTDNDETDYDYGEKTKEKLNKGYVLAMEYSANYGGEGTSKNDANYYSEDVKITPWDYNDRALSPDKVELKVLSLDLASGWQSVGILDPKNGSFTEKKTLTDTTVEYDSINKLVKLKPTEISNNKNGKGTTNGPLKILRSAKHYYGLNLSRGGNEEFDCKNYEEYAYRQITDEEIFKSTMLVLAKIIYDSKMEENFMGTVIGTSTTVSGFDGGLFSWAQSSSSDLSWSITPFVEGWEKFPCEEYKNIDDYKNNGSIPSFIKIFDSSSLAVRGRKQATNILFLCKDGFSNIETYEKSEMIPIGVSFYFSSEIDLKSYNCTVNFKANGKKDSYKKGSFIGVGGTTYNVYIGFNGSVVRDGVTSNEYSYGSSEDAKDELRKWIPISFCCEGYHGENPAYGWWDN